MTKDIAATQGNVSRTEDIDGWGGSEPRCNLAVLTRPRARPRAWPRGYVTAGIEIIHRNLKFWRPCTDNSNLFDICVQQS